MKKYYIILTVLFLASCHLTRNISTKYFDNHGFEAARYFQENFPISEDSVFIKGETKYKTDTTYRNDTTIIHKVDTIKKEITRYIFIRDTVSRLDTLKITNIDSTKLYLLSHINKRKTKDSIILQTKYVDAKQKAKTRGLLMWGTWVLIVIVVGIGIFFKIKVGALKSVINKIKENV